MNRRYTPPALSERIWIWGTVILSAWTLIYFIGRPIARALGVF